MKFRKFVKKIYDKFIRQHKKFDKHKFDNHKFLTKS